MYGPGSASGAPSSGNARSIISRVMPGGCAKHTPVTVKSTAAATMVLCMVRFSRSRIQSQYTLRPYYGLSRTAGRSGRLYLIIEMARKRFPATVLFRSLFFSGSLSLIATFAQPLGKGVISGTVVDGESGDAIRKAVVTLSLPGPPRRWATTRTDGSGRFQFDGLPAGKYDLRATKASEGSAIYGANHLRELGDTITLGDGETRGNITLRFLHSASISGHVYDSDGETVADVTVNLLRQGRNLGAPILTNYRNATTDDRGEYHISSIDPGQYYLHTAPSRLGRFGGPDTGSEPILVDQFYGGARDSKDAAPIHVGGGESLAGLDFRLIAEPAVEVRGQILGVPAESAPESPPAESEHFGGLTISHGGMGGPGIRVTVTPAEAGSLNGQGRWTQS